MPFKTKIMFEQVMAQPYGAEASGGIIGHTDGSLKADIASTFGASSPLISRERVAALRFSVAPAAIINGDGTWTSPSGTNLIDSASSIYGAVELLDEAVGDATAGYYISDRLTSQLAAGSIWDVDGVANDSDSGKQVETSFAADVLSSGVTNAQKRLRVFANGVLLKPRLASGVPHVGTVDSDTVDLGDYVLLNGTNKGLKFADTLQVGAELQVRY